MLTTSIRSLDNQMSALATDVTIIPSQLLPIYHLLTLLYVLARHLLPSREPLPQRATPLWAPLSMVPD